MLTIHFLGEDSAA